ncbi:MAG: hypothetical protein FD127_4397, partial [Acidimicrobiaceae bacterium]
GVETCNGVDDDCNGSSDDGIAIVPCGMGACTVTPATACTAGMPTTCTPGTPGTETCNGIDDDCNGVVDDPCGCDRYVRLGGSGTGMSAGSPMGSIAAAITSMAGAPGTICVAAQSAGGTCTRTTYNEAVNMTEGIVLLGNHDSAGWTRGNPLCETVIQAQNTNGVFFGHALTNATQIDGFTVLGSSASSGPGSGTTTAAMTVQEGATITNNAITGGNRPTSYGILFTAPGAVSAVPVVDGNTITGGSGGATVTSVGVRVSMMAPAITNNTIRGGTASGTSRAIELSSGAGTMIADNPIVEGAGATNSHGINVGGSSAGVVITRNASIRGRSTGAQGFGIRLEGST